MHNIVFAGTSGFAEAVLAAILAVKCKPISVYTMPSRPAGRGLQLLDSPVKQLADRAGIAVRQPASLKQQAEQAYLADLAPDLMIVAAYGLIVPASILAIPRLGCVNVHASLLPRWRGASPIQQAIMAGDAITGITLMQMDPGLDTGPILVQQQLDIVVGDTAASLHSRLAKLAGELLVQKLPAILAAQLPAVPQPDAGVAYAGKIDKQDARIRWSESGVLIERKVRAFYPWPIAFTTYQDKLVKIISSELCQTTNLEPPGTIVRLAPAGIEVATGDDHGLRIKSLQLAGGKVVEVASFINAQGRNWQIGTSFV